MDFLKNRRFLTEFAALYGVQIANIVLPLLTLPILGHSLGVKAYGSYVIIQSIITLISLVIEFGFNFSATRMIAKSDEARYSHIVSDILGAKVILSILILILMPILFLLSGGFGQDIGPSGLIIIVAGALSAGWMPIWYFQGRESLSQFAVVDVGVKVCSIALLFFLVNDSNDIYLALIITASASIVSCLYGHARMFRQVGHVKLDFKRSFDTLIKEKDMAIYRALSSSIGSINSILLGAFTTTSIVANYAGADKLAGGSRFFITPFNQIFFTRVSRYGKSDLDRARKEFLYSFWLLLIISILIIGVGWMLAPKIISIFLGKGFSDAVLILRWLLLITPLYILGNTLSMQWMVPLGMDRVYNLIIGGGALVNISLMLFIVPRYGAMGIVAVVGLIELLICLTMLIYLTLLRKNPFLNL